MRPKLWSSAACNRSLSVDPSYLENELVARSHVVPCPFVTPELSYRGIEGVRRGVHVAGMGTGGFFVLAQDEENLLDAFAEVFVGWSVGDLGFGAAVLDYSACGAAAEIGLFVADGASGDEAL